MSLSTLFRLIYVQNAACELCYLQSDEYAELMRLIGDGVSVRIVTLADEGTTTKAAQALEAIRTYDSGMHLHAAMREFQHAWHGGQDLDDDAFYREYAERMGWQGDTLLAAMAADSTAEGIADDARLVQELGVASAPSLLLLQDREGWIISQGLTRAEEMYGRIRRIMERQSQG